MPGGKAPVDVEDAAPTSGPTRGRRLGGGSSGGRRDGRQVPGLDLGESEGLVVPSLREQLPSQLAHLLLEPVDAGRPQLLGVDPQRVEQVVHLRLVSDREAERDRLAGQARDLVLACERLALGVVEGVQLVGGDHASRQIVRHRSAAQSIAKRGDDAIESLRSQDVRRVRRRRGRRRGRIRALFGELGSEQVVREAVDGATSVDEAGDPVPHRDVVGNRCSEDAGMQDAAAEAFLVAPDAIAGRSDVRVPVSHSQRVVEGLLRNQVLRVAVRELPLGDLPQSRGDFARLANQDASAVALLGAQHRDQVLEHPEVLVVLQVSFEQEVDQASNLVGMLRGDQWSGGAEVDDLEALQELPRSQRDVVEQQVHAVQVVSVVRLLALGAG
jgi:hypothetical protein